MTQAVSYVQRPPKAGFSRSVSVLLWVCMLCLPERHMGAREVEVRTGNELINELRNWTGGDLVLMAVGNVINTSSAAVGFSTLPPLASTVVNEGSVSRLCTRRFCRI